MKVEFLDKFNRDLDKLDNKKVKESVKQLIIDLESVSSSDEIKNLKKLSGFKNAYRIRLGNFRVGIFIEKDVIELARIADRKNIYRIFP